LKAWKFGAKTEAMNAEQRDIFEETLAADQASLQAQLAALQQGGVRIKTWTGFMPQVQDSPGIRSG
ncbi:hypothetical protein NFX52_30740, partial [Acidovorax facilis]|uniref:hypothetical protein n=1 Tax=Acidovorax facilis TaxID=12917 RepID=UPI00208F478F